MTLTIYVLSLVRLELVQNDINTGMYLGKILIEKQLNFPDFEFDLHIT